MRNETFLLLSCGFTLLALTACLPQVQQDEEQQAIQQPLDTAVPAQPTQPTDSTPTETRAISPTPEIIPPSGTPIPTKEASMTTEPTPDQTNPPTNEPNLQPAVQTWINHAQKDLAQRLGIATNEIELVSFETKTWPDSSLGCPQPGMRYLQVLKEGYLILLRAGNDLYNYHGSSGTPPFLCQQLAFLKPPLTPKVDEFVPPPGSDID